MKNDAIDLLRRRGFIEEALVLAAWRAGPSGGEAFAGAEITVTDKATKQSITFSGPVDVRLVGGPSLLENLCIEPQRIEFSATCYGGAVVCME